MAKVALFKGLEHPPGRFAVLESVQIQNGYGVEGVGVVARKGFRAAQGFTGDSGLARVDGGLRLAEDCGNPFGCQRGGFAERVDRLSVAVAGGEKAAKREGGAPVGGSESRARAERLFLQIGTDRKSVV